MTIDPRAAEPNRTSQCCGEPYSRRAAHHSTNSISWSRLILLALLLNSALLFNGCDNKATYFSLGLLAPCAELEFPNNSVAPTKLNSVSPAWCTVNVAAMLVLFWLALKRRRVSEFLGSGKFLGVLMATVLLFNSFLVVPPVWEYGVWSPTIRIFGALDWAFSAGDEAEKVLINIASRTHFFMCMLIGYSSVRLGQIVFQRYVFIAPDRWWQFKLGGLLTMMVVFGAGIGLLVRLIMH